MKRLFAGFASILLFCAALPADAQSPARERAVKRCMDNRGTDCKTDQGLRPWIDEEGPTTYTPHRRPSSPRATPPASTSPPPASPSSARSKS
jgi:hypothetical protein